MVRVRIGPSPTGDPHVGTAYIALFNFVFAQQQGGQFVLRVEDTDRERSKPQWETMLVEALRWLGLSWNEGPDVGGPFGPYRQSERGAIYREHVDMLLRRGAAYPCFCTPERLTQLRQAQRARKENPGYDGHCRDLGADEVRRRLQDGAVHVVRLAVPREGTTQIRDRLRGEVVFDNAQIDDQVLLKSDGMPTYHLANVVDDHLMEISHVMRAEEWITSTPKHALLYRAFGWQPPVWIHMPLLRNRDKSKISKRKNPVSLNFYREAGIYPEALRNYLGMMGWTMPDGREKFSLADMIEHFTFERISLGGPVFDADKLSWLNGVYIRDYPVDDLTRRLRQTLFSDEQLAAIAPLVQARIDKLEDFIDKTAFFFQGELVYSSAALAAMVPKKKEAKEVAKVLRAAVEVIDAMPVLALETCENLMRELCAKLGWKTGELFMPLRVAITGSKATPPLFECIVVLGKERTRRRLRHAAALLEKEQDHGKTLA